LSKNRGGGPKNEYAAQGEPFEGRFKHDGCVRVLVTERSHYEG
jgi:hypothetical protein